MPVTMMGGGSVTSAPTAKPTPNYSGAVNKLQNTITPTNNTTQKLYQSATKPPASAKVSLPSTAKTAAAQAPKTPAPVYSGSSINSIPHVASSLGAHSQQNPDGTYSVNNVVIKPISTVNGEGHAPVSTVASAAGYHPSLVQQSPQGTTVMPNVHPSTASQPSVAPLNQYWSNVKNAGGAYANPSANGMSVQQQVQNEAQLYGINPSQVQVVKDAQGNVRTFVPWQYVQAHAEAMSNPQPAPQPQQTQPSPSIINSYPQAPGVPQMPLFDSSSLQPFNWNMGQDYANVYQSLNPTYQQQMTASDQALNDKMNMRGIYNSGLAQQAQMQNDQGLIGKEWQAIGKQVTSDQSTALKAWQDNITNQLNAYKDNIDTMYKTGQLTNAQYADEINIWKQQVSYAQNQYNQQMAMQKALIPYTMGPTPAQMLPYQYPTANAQLPYLYPTQNAMLPYEGMTQYQQGTLSLDQSKFQEAVQQNQVSDAQKWATIMGYDANGNPTLNMQKFQETAANDLQKASQAAANASSTAAKNQLTGLHDQLVAAGTYITNLTAQGVKANDPTMQQAVQNYNSINDEIAGIVAGMGTTSGGSAQYSPGSPLAVPN